MHIDFSSKKLVYTRIDDGKLYEYFIVQGNDTGKFVNLIYVDGELILLDDK